MRTPRSLFVALVYFFLASGSAFCDDEPVPAFNPLGDMAAYTSVSYSQNTWLDLEIPMNEGFQTLSVKGDVWYLGYSGDDLAEMIGKVKAYGEAQGAEFLRWDEYNAVLRKDMGEGEVWWLRARFESGLEMVVAKTLRLDPGKPVTFAMGEGGHTEVHFHTQNPGGRFRSIVAKIPEGEFTLEASQILRAGAYTRTLSGKWSMDAGRSKRFALDAIPQEPGECQFTLYTNPDSPAVNVELLLEEHDQRVPVPVMGEKLGALRVKNVPYGSASVRPAGRFVHTSVEHPEFPGSSGFENGDVTPEGDAYFLLPAGLWQVEVMPSEQNVASALRSQFVPVSSGQETVLDWPLAMTSVFGAKDGNGLVVNSVAREGAEVDVTFSLHGPEAEGLEPAVGELVVKEGGSPGKVLSLKRTKVPLDIVLLVDSSGSMKGQMKNALEATKKFLEALPDDAHVRLVDFDTKQRPLEGTTKSQALAGLSSIKANGATSLNDSVLLGLQMLGGSQRPALLVFTDGFDANHDDSGPGSKATKEDVLTAVAAAQTPVFTIGFGTGHDVSTLDRIASLSGGRYYAASDPDSLNQVFAVISSNLSNTFTARYARPAKGRPSDAPVITCMMDISGSMNLSPDMDGCDYRIDKVKAILHDFFLSLPENTLAQAMTFSEENTIQQVTTSSMGAILAALNDVDPDGGTEIAQAVTAVFEAQKAIPSTKRYLLFLTDAALEVDAEDKLLFDTMLAKLRDEGIHCLWAGIGALNDAPFKYAAEASGGRYVMTEDPDELGRAFEEMIAEIRKPTATDGDVTTMVELTLNHREASGRNLTFAGADQADLPVLKTDSEVEVPASISYAVRELKERFDPEVAGLITGDSMPIRDARITKRIPIGVTGHNEAARFTVREAYFLNRMHGLDAPTGYRFLALTMDLENLLPKQTVLVYPDGSNHPAAWVGNDKATRGKEVEMVPTYLIPDLPRHLFLRWNNEVMTPVSPVTWLAEAPLMVPGENEVAIAPKETVTGAVVFLAPEGNMRQMSLHYYDTVYGHAAIPLVGTMPDDTDRLSSLPALPPAKLSDAFSLAVREVRDAKKIGEIEAEGDSVFRIVEADLISNVQALLDVDPAKRFSLRLNTTEGALPVRLHEATAMLPLGFYSPTMLSPGSGNRIRLAFRVPASVPEEAGLGELMVDVQGGGVVIPLNDTAASAPLATLPDNAMRGDGISLQINAFGPQAGQDGVFVADLTLFDEKDGKSTQLSGAFMLRKKNFEPGPGFEPPPPDFGKSKGLAGFATGNAIIPVGTMPPAFDTDDMVFGITDDTVVPDGGSLRGVILFKLPNGDADPAEWALTSPIFADLKADITSDEYEETRLLVRRQTLSVPFTDTLMDELVDVVAELKRQREARRFEKPGHFSPKAKDLEGKAPAARAVPVPEATDPARADFASIRTLKDLKARLKNVRCLPIDLGQWKHLFAPEAVLTQDWGSQTDFAYMAEVVLARQGVTTKRLTVELTDRGREELAKMIGLPAQLYSLPALAYRDDDGTSHVLVAPFLETTAQLPGMIGKVESNDVSVEPKTATVTVSLLARPVQSGQSRAGRELSDALSGDEDTGAPEPVYLLTANPTLPELSRGAVDLGYTVVGHGNGPVIKAIFDGNDRRVIGSDTIDSGDYEIVGERIVIFLDDAELVAEYMLEEGESIVDRFHTLGLNLPDMDMNAARKLDTTLQSVRKMEDAPDNLSALKWYGRNLIYRFVCAQSEYERDLAAKMNLTVGRATKPRCIIATVSRPQGSDTVRTSLDLRRIANEVHSGISPEAVHGFNIMSGLFASRLEADVMPGGGLGFFQMLPHYPADTRFFWLTSNARYDMEEDLKRSMSEPVFKLLMQSRGTVLFPDQPALVNGKQRWAWLEVDPDSYQTISVLDTGERGAMVERVFTDLWKEGLDFIVGGLVGVSSSIWSVSAFSLMLDDYKEILAAAKKFALGLADNFSATVKVGDFEFKGTVGSPTIEPGYSGPGAGAVGAAMSGKTLYDKVKEPKIELGGFEGGFKAGVNFYFSQAGE